MSRIYNFSAGPAILPEDVLLEAQAQFADYKGAGMSLIEMSHRGKEYEAVHNEAMVNLKRLMGLGDDFTVLFQTGGASGQFALVPLNLLGEGQTADYINAGSWGGKAIKPSLRTEPAARGNARTRWPDHWPDSQASLRTR